MRILWICGGLLPQALIALGRKDTRINGGFMGASFDEIVNLDDSNEFCVLSWDKRECDCQVGRVRHVSFGGQRIDAVAVSDEACREARNIMASFCPDIVHILGTEGIFAHMPLEVFGNHKVVVSMQGVMGACAEAFSGGLLPEDIKVQDNLNFRVLRHGATIWREQSRWRNVRAMNEAKTIQSHKYFIGRTVFDRSWVKFYNPSARYFSVNETMRKEFYSSNGEDRCVVKHSIYCGGAAGYPLKGAHWLFRAIAALKPVYPDIQLRIANASYLNPSCSIKNRMHLSSYHKYLKRLVVELGIAENICLLSALDAQGVGRELNQAELFVLHSLCENSSNALCEAMLSETPCVATFSGGTPSIIDNGKTGVLVPPNDPAALSEGIRTLFEDEKLARSYAQEAKRVAQTRHNPVLNAKRLLSVYNAILEDRK